MRRMSVLAITCLWSSLAGFQILSGDDFLPISGLQAFAFATSLLILCTVCTLIAHRLRPKLQPIPISRSSRPRHR